MRTTHDISPEELTEMLIITAHPWVRRVDWLNKRPKGRTIAVYIHIDTE